MPGCSRPPFAPPSLRKCSPMFSTLLGFPVHPSQEPKEWSAASVPIAADSSLGQSALASSDSETGPRMAVPDPEELWKDLERESSRLQPPGHSEGYAKTLGTARPDRSEERRVGKECRLRAAREGEEQKDD